MPTLVVVGLQFGDEGKGKIVDLLAETADLVVRYNGGANAGHTVANDKGTFKLHLVPSGIFNARARCFLGNGAVIDPEVLIQELAGLSAAGIATDRFRVSSRAHVVMPWHKTADAAAEAAKGKAAIGTTGRGIGPCYMDKVSRVGIRIGELLDPDSLCAKIMRMNGPPGFLNGFDFNSVRRWAATLGPAIADTDALARESAAGGERILLEAAQGTMIDLEVGTYPFVTSSYATAAGACIGSGLPPGAIDEVVGVAKAYITRVGNGPMPTELDDEVGAALRRAGNEFGTTTGRPRRCGWFDAPLVRYAAEVNGLHGIILTKLDVLSGMQTLRIATAYEFDGQLRGRPMVNAEPYGRYLPVYEECEPWDEPIAGITDWNDLPAAAQRYVERIEELVGVPIDMVATGPRREDIIKRY